MTYYILEILVLLNEKATTTIYWNWYSILVFACQSIFQKVQNVHGLNVHVLLLKLTTVVLFEDFED
jgi:hypothetical protein